MSGPEAFAEYIQDSGINARPPKLLDVTEMTSVELIAKLHNDFVSEHCKDHNLASNIASVLWGEVAESRQDALCQLRRL